MTRAYQAYFSDYVCSPSGAAVAGATVNLYLAAQFNVPPFPTGSTAAVPIASAITDASGFYAFDHLIPDDYYLQVSQPQASGVPLIAWKYQVPIFTYEETRRTRQRTLAAPLARTLSRLHGGQNVLICCVGDSVTVGFNSSQTTATSYVAVFAQGLAALYPAATVLRLDPQAFGTTSDAAIPAWTTIPIQQPASATQTITVANCGVSGDTCLRVMRRFANLSANGLPDLVTVFLGVNDSLPSDATKYVDALSFEAHLAALCRQMRDQLGSDLLLLTPHTNNVPNLDAYADATRAVAAAARCGLVDLRRLWLDHADPAATPTPFGVWLDPTPGNATHPSDLGHQAIAAELLRPFAVSLEVPLGAGPTPAALGAGKTAEAVRIPWETAGLTPATLSFHGTGWQAHSGFALQNLLASSNAAGAGEEFFTGHPGDTLTFSARCIEVAMLCRRWQDSGAISVAVDGVLTTPFLDMYRAYPAAVSDLTDYNGAVAPQDRLVLARGLSDAVHSVTLTLLAGKNAASSNTYWRFDGIDLLRQRPHGYQVEALEPLSVLLRGAVTISLASQAYGSATVQFARPFPMQGGVPTVVASTTNVNYFAVVGALTAQSVQIFLVRRDGAAVTDAQTVLWLAVGC